MVREDAPGTCDGMTVRDALRWATGVLVAENVDSPRLDAELILGHLLEESRAGLYAHDHQALSHQVAAGYTRLVRRRMAREPLAYVIGRRAFYDVDLVVDSRALIPRPETEHLVDAALEWCRHMPLPNPRIIDVGTGSGAIAIVLARHLPDARVTAADYSADALALATRNAERYGLGERIAFVQSDLLASVSGPFDAVTANLPYVPSAEVAGLQPEVSQYEPHLALDGGTDGLALIRRLMAQLGSALARPGLALFEIDRRQSLAVAECAQEHLQPCDVHVMADLAGLDRVVKVCAMAG